MNINVMFKYKVSSYHKYSYRYRDDFGDIEFKTENNRWTKIFDGFELTKFLSTRFSNSDNFEISFVDNKIIIDCFDPTTGETSIEILTIKEKNIE